jgi:hypothetical protein
VLLRVLLLRLLRVTPALRSLRLPVRRHLRLSVRIARDGLGGRLNRRLHGWLNRRSGHGSSPDVGVIVG